MVDQLRYIKIMAAASERRAPRRDAESPDGFLTIQDYLDIARETATSVDVVSFVLDNLTINAEHPRSCTCRSCQPR